jgi:hypothetical protein
LAKSEHAFKAPREIGQVQIAIESEVQRGQIESKPKPKQFNAQPFRAGTHIEVKVHIEFRETVTTRV